MSCTPCVRSSGLTIASQWWKRVQWATDLVRSDDDTTQQLGLVALTAMIREDEEVDDTDDQLLAGIIELVLQVGETQDELDTEASPQVGRLTRRRRSLRWVSRVLRRASERLERA